MQHTMVAVRVPFLSMLAESCIALGQHAQALEALNLAEQAVDAFADFHYCAELARLRAHGLAATAAPRAAVLDQLLRAADTARSQGAPLLELRALDDLLALAPADDPASPPQAAWRARRSALRAGLAAVQA